MARPDRRDDVIDDRFADQAHLYRTTRRLSGSSPQALRWRLEHGEAFWVYRLLT